METRDTTQPKSRTQYGGLIQAEGVLPVAGIIFLAIFMLKMSQIMDGMEAMINHNGMAVEIGTKVVFQIETNQIQVGD